MNDIVTHSTIDIFKIKFLNISENLRITSAITSSNDNLFLYWVELELNKNIA